MDDFWVTIEQSFGQIVDYLGNVRFPNHVFTIILLLLALGTANGTVISFLYGLIDKIDSSVKSVRIQRIESALNGIYGNVIVHCTILLLVIIVFAVRCFTYCPTTASYPSGWGLLNSSIYMLIFFLLLNFTYSGFIVGRFVYSKKRGNSLQNRLHSPHHKSLAFVKMKNGNTISGILLNLDFLNTDRNIELLNGSRKDGGIDWVEKSQINGIFLIGEKKDDPRLLDSNFTFGPRNLKLKRPSEEKFPMTRSYEVNGFTVMKIDKKSTSTRYVIAPTQNIEQIDN